MGVIEGTNKIGQGLGGGRPKVAAAIYDASVDAKTEGEKTLRGDTIPAGAIIIDSLIQVDTAPTSGGSAKISAGVASVTDLQASKGVGEAPWSTTGAKRGAITATSTPASLTEAKPVKIKIETAALLTGKFRVFVTYLAA